MQTIFQLKFYKFSIIALALSGLITSSLSFAGGHGNAQKRTEPVVFDPAKRSDTKGTVLVSGSNRGIGLAMVRNYAERGWTVIATARKPDKAEDLQNLAADYPDQIRIEQMDLLDLGSIDALAKSLNGMPIDVLLNNAALMGEPNDQSIGAFDYELAERVHAINVTGTLKMIETLLPNVEASNQKKVVGISSTQGSVASLREPGIVFYKMSKAALNMGLRAQSRALKKRGVTVAIVSPGAVDTDMMNLALDRAGVKFKLLTTEQSAEAVINVIGQYEIKQTGVFMGHDGKEVPW
ncbi:MAG: SDR family oxidoreductase [Pseudomonadota bacterium]|nr:SDR family oxidoreductase [Pseudomonadota bacterium]